MTNSSRLAKNTFFLALANIFPKFFMIALTVYAARKLGSEGLGEYAIATSVVGLFSVLTDLGLNSLFVREVARQKDKAGAYLGSMLTLKAILSLLVLGLIFLAARVLDYNETVTRTIYLLAVGLVFSSFISLLTALFQAYEEMKFNAVFGIINSALLTIGGIVALFFGYGVVGLGWTSVLAGVIVLATVVLTVMQKFRFSDLGLSRSFLQRFLREAVPFALVSVLITIYYRTDMLLLSKLPLSNLSNEVAVGLYSASYKFIDVLQMIPAVVTGAAFPLFSRLHIEDQDKLFLVSQRILRYLIFLAVPIAVGTTLLAKPIIRLAYGAEFLPAATSLQILIWAVGLIFVNSLFASILTSINRMKVLVILTAVSVVISITLNLILIPTWGLGLSFIGASLTTLLTETVALSLAYYYFSRFVYPVELAAILSKPIFAALLMGLTIVLIGRAFFLSLLVAPIVYFLALYLLKAFDSGDREVLSGLLKIRSST